ncbi:MAG: DUF5372 family protein, partial [Scytonema sp. PMC 1069.18]|nr:DUF5372 family protein [Scytonema sp. PMC 1069.18]MEC4888126.1 DUF5372 family protein [Scytonema sp. PMC 1070.18]
GRYTKTAHNFNKPLGNDDRVTITNPIHPLYGQLVVVRSLRKVGELTLVLVEHPDGGLISLPIDETNFQTPKLSVQLSGTPRLFEPKKLLRLSELVAAQLKMNNGKISCVPELSTVEHKKTNEKTSTKCSTASRRRTDEKAGQTNGTLSGQDTQHNRSRRQTSKES